MTTTLLVQLAISLLLYVASKPFMYGFISRAIVLNETHDKFLRHVLRFVYACSASVVLAWLVFGSAASYFIVFSTFCLLVLLQFDLEDEDGGYLEARKSLMSMLDEDS